MSTESIGIEAAAKKRTAKKATKRRTAKAKESKGPGVIASIIEYLQGASATAPVTKDELVKKLTARFKDRDAKALRTTVNCQVPTRLKSDKKLTVKKNENGYWLPAAK